jgi:hypothetical protein
LGKRIGRPRAHVDVGCVTTLRTEGASLRQIARTLDIPVSRVRRALIAPTPAGRDDTPGDLLDTDRRTPAP